MGGDEGCVGRGGVWYLKTRQHPAHVYASATNAYLIEHVIHPAAVPCEGQLAVEVTIRLEQLLRGASLEVLQQAEKGLRWLGGHDRAVYQ